VGKGQGGGGVYVYKRVGGGGVQRVKRRWSGREGREGEERVRKKGAWGGGEEGGGGTARASLGKEIRVMGRREYKRGEVIPLSP